METKLTVVVDNIACDNLAGEWGLCILAEHRGKKILVDAGASELFAENMQKLGFEINDVDYATLSHAHYDHANGMPRFFKENDHAKFYIRDAAEENCYGKKWIFSRYIGMPKGVLADYANRIEKVSGDYQVMDGAWLIPHKTEGLEAIGKRESMYQRNGKRWRPDNFNHEQSLVLETDCGLVIINCCSHGGAVNIINEVAATFPDKPVYGIIGGFHLFNKSEEEVRAVARKLIDTGVKSVSYTHLTLPTSLRV